MFRPREGQVLGPSVLRLEIDILVRFWLKIMLSLIGFLFIESITFILDWFPGYILLESL